MTDRSSKSMKDKLQVSISAKCMRRCCLFIMFQASIFRACTNRLRQDSSCPENELIIDGGRRSSAKLSGGGHFSRLANSRHIQRAFTVYTRIVLSLYASWVTVSIATILLDIDQLAAYRYLDCYLPGRFTLNARSSFALKYVCLELTIAELIMRGLTTFGNRDFYLPVLHFLHRDLADIEQCVDRQDLMRHRMLEPFSANLGNHSKSIGSGKQGEDSDSVDGFDLYYKRYARLDDYTNKWIEREYRDAGLDWHKDGGEDLEDSLMFTRSSSLTSGYAVLRLNRRRSCWLKLSASMLVGMLAIGVALVVWFVAMILLMTPTIVTRRGFELSYPNCVSYIRDYTKASEFVHIYRELDGNFTALATDRNKKIGKSLEKLPIILPMKDFVSGYYHLVRMLSDYTKTVIFFIDGIAFLLVLSLLQLLVCYDIALNADEIYKRLHRLHTTRLESSLLNELGFTKQHRVSTATNPKVIKRHFSSIRNQKCARLRPRPTVILEATRSKTDPRCEQAAAKTLETLLLQALVMDHFKMVQKCNGCISFLAISAIITWLILNCIFFAWLGFTGIRDRLPQEWIVFMLIMTAFLFIYLVTISSVSSINRQFYPLISSLLALEGDDLIIRRNWMTIIDHFKPRPLYCFTLISKEMSLLLVLKILAWLFSAMAVILSFFVTFK